MIDFKFCEIDSNYVPAVEVDGEIACQYCFEAYGEINQAFSNSSACRLDTQELVCTVYGHTGHPRSQFTKSYERRSKPRS